MSVGDFGAYGYSSKIHDIFDTRMLFYSAAAQNPTYPAGVDANGNWVKNSAASHINHPGALLYEKNDSEELNFNTHLGLKFSIFDNLILSAFGSYSYSTTGNAQFCPTWVWARDGLTDEQISHNIGITRETLNQWKNRFSDISDTLKRGKDVVDREVENALFKRAVGYEYDEVKEKYECGVLTERTITKKMVVPDTTAQIFWLKNRKPEEWRDKRQVEEKIEFESDGFIEALNNQAKDVFAEAGDIVET